MAYLADCPSCKAGNHDGHVANWKPAPKGVMGGAYCGCKGDCAERAEKRRKRFTDRLGPITSEDPEART